MTRSGRQRRVTLLLLALPFVACFAEPMEPAAPGTGVGGSLTGTGGAGNGGSVGIGSRTSSTGGDAALAAQGGQPSEAGANGTDAEMGGSGDDITTSECHHARAEPLPARRAILSDKAPEPEQSGPRVLTLTKKSLYADFVKRGCGDTKCHGGKGDPNAQPPETFQVTEDTFDQRATLGEEALARVTSSDEDTWMPPDEGDGSKRGTTHPYVVLAKRLLAWQKAGFPDPFLLQLDDAPDTGAGVDPYLLSPALGESLTNIGSCVPDQATVLLAVASEVQEKDALFASLQTSDDLPDTLLETDLVTLDSFQLGRRRVFSYAPTYPLYSDHAGKMRHVRVPVGQSIHYDETLRDFVIPDNTRFYKTFLKQVKDKDGNVGYRKMETRLIVVRKDEQLPDGTFKTHALRASYAWNRNETMAQRVKDPFRDGTAAADRLCPYVVDEGVTRDPARNPISDKISETCEYMTPEEMAAPSSGQIRHYAIPSTQRCDQCHMGSSSHSYVLGFTPWQVDRRAPGEGGIYEDPLDDELDQLERFLDYGIITGIKPGEAKLEESQAIADPPRYPRNDYELTAQGYMLGNCAFCHNPHGFPVVQNPVLRPFELFPGEKGGIFQFSLDRFSPRAKAGPGQNFRIPYITSVFSDTTNELDRGAAKSVNPLGVPVTDPNKYSPDYDPVSGKLTYLGLWGSLIWRNVYTPFTYEEHGAIFVHMPRNAAGYDCRAHKIMANWMLSIPSTRSVGDGAADQQAREVTAADSANLQKVAQLQLADRLKAYAEGVTGQWCPNDDDLVDPEVILSPLDPDTGHKLLGAPQDHGISGPRIVPDYPFSAVTERDAVPDHAHWVPTDTTDRQGKWVPRRSDWKEVIVTREVPVTDPLSKVIDDLQTIHLSPEAHSFALEELPTGLWHQDCQSTSEALASPRVSDIAGAPLAGPVRRWLSGNSMDADPASPDPDTTLRVHLQRRGEVVFRQICQNCHGKDADSKSPLAATMLELTGGDTRVANFLDGLFGPRSAPGAYAREEFTIDAGATPEDWQVRYMLFMGLGGTKATIPDVVLNLVATSPFYGKAVTAPNGQKTPNMLQSALALCGSVLGQSRKLKADKPAPVMPLGNFATGTGHYEVWESLCNFGNEPVVRALAFDQGNDFSSRLTFRSKDDAGHWVYPPDRLVGDQDGQVVRGIQPSNVGPWCFMPAPDDVIRQKMVTWAKGQGLTEADLPACPPELLAEAFGKLVNRVAVGSDGTIDPSEPFGNQAFAEHWIRRGAMNAGMSAYYYLNGVTSGEFTPNKPFDFCRQ
jgi:mono/diheme cytochrome c family protein